jgi:hypothetical protein
VQIGLRNAGSEPPFVALAHEDCISWRFSSISHSTLAGAGAPPVRALRLTWTVPYCCRQSKLRNDRANRPVERELSTGCRQWNARRAVLSGQRCRHPSPPTGGVGCENQAKDPRDGGDGPQTLGPTPDHRASPGPGVTRQRTQADETKGATAPPLEEQGMASLSIAIGSPLFGNRGARRGPKQVAYGHPDPPPECPGSVPRPSAPTGVISFVSKLFAKKTGIRCVAEEEQGRARKDLAPPVVSSRATALRCGVRHAARKGRVAPSRRGPGVRVQGSRWGLAKTPLEYAESRAYMVHDVPRGRAIPGARVTSLADPATTREPPPPEVRVNRSSGLQKWTVTRR